MATTPATKKRKLSSLSGGHHSKIYVQDTGEYVSEDSSNEESDIFPRTGATRNPHATVEARRTPKTSCTSGTYDSNMFKLKVNELLAKSVSPIVRQSLSSKRSATRFTTTRSQSHSPNPGPKGTQNTRWPTPNQRISML